MFLELQAALYHHLHQPTTPVLSSSGWWLSNGMPQMHLPSRSSRRFTSLLQLSTPANATPPPLPLGGAPPPSSDSEEEVVTHHHYPFYWANKIRRLCSTRGGVDHALRLLDRLRLLGYRPDSLTLTTLLHALCLAGRSLDAHRRLLLSLASGWLPDHRTSNLLLSRFPPDLTLLRLLLSANPSFLPSPANYNRLIHRFCALSRPADARTVFLDMKHRGQPPNVVSYTTLIDGFGRIGQLDAARHLFDEMLASGVTPNSLTYSVFLRALLRKRRIREAREMMGQLWVSMAGDHRTRINNAAAFANLVDALCREGLFHDVFKLAEEMPPLGDKCVVGEDFAYGQMMDSLCRVRRHHAASRIVYMMMRRGFTPSAVSFNCIVHGLSKRGEGGCMRAYQLLKEGAEWFRYSPSEPTYKSLVEGLCSVGDLHKAKDVTEFMLHKEEEEEEEGGVHKTRIYNIFLNALRLVGNPSQLLNVLVSMLQQNRCRPDVVTLNTVIHGFCEMGKVGEALRILNDMLEGKFCAPDAVTFTTILRGLLDAGRAEEALHMLHYKMPQCSCPPGTVTYNAVLGGLCKLLRVDEAMVVFDEMARRAVSADTRTHAIIVQGLFGSGRVSHAKRFWEDVIWPSGVHDDFVYAAILKGLCDAGKLDEGCDFLYELVDCGVAPGIVNYNILIHGACKLGSKREAYRMVSEMRRNGLVPDAVTWRTLDKLHRKFIGEDQNPCPQASESQRLVLREEETTPGHHPTGKTAEPPRIEECQVQMEMEGAALDDGIAGRDFPMELSDGEIDNRDDGSSSRRKILSGDLTANRALSSQSALREPLSKVARRVFGLI